MARNPIVFIDVDKQKYLGRDAQVAALAPFPARHNGDHWQLNRKPFAHAAYPGLMVDRTGSEDPRLKAAKRAAIDAGVDLDLVEALTLDQLLVTPDTVSGEVGGRFITTTVSNPAARAPQRTGASYKILDTGGIAVLDLNFNGAPGINTNQRTASRSMSVHGPIYATALHLSTRELQGLETYLQITCPELGLNWSPATDSAASITPPNVNLPLNFVIEKATTWQMYAEALDTLPNAQAFSANLILAYRDVVREG